MYLASAFQGLSYIFYTQSSLVCTWYWDWQTVVAPQFLDWFGGEETCISSTCSNYGAWHLVALHWEIWHMAADKTLLHCCHGLLKKGWDENHLCSEPLCQILPSCLVFVLEIKLELVLGTRSLTWCRRMQSSSKWQLQTTCTDYIYTLSKLMRTPHGLLIILYYQNEHSLQYYCIFWCRPSDFDSIKMHQAGLAKQAAFDISLNRLIVSAWLHW